MRITRMGCDAASPKKKIAAQRIAPFLAVCFLTVVTLIAILAPNSAELARMRKDEAAQKEIHYHKVIAGTVFTEQRINEDAAPWLEGMEKDVNRYRLQAAKLAIDQTSCGYVQASDPSVDSSLVLGMWVTCDDGRKLLYSQEAIDTGGDAIDVERPTAASSQDDDSIVDYWGRKRRQEQIDCMAGGLVGCTKPN